MFKLLKYLVILIVLAVVAGVAALYLSLDGIVKRVVEMEGTAQLNVPTTLGGASLGLLHGTVGLTELAVGSPAGFTAPQMLTVGGLTVDTGGITHLRDKPIRVADVELKAPHLVVEQKGTTLNVKQLLAGLPGRDAAGRPAPSPATADQNPVRLVIDHLAITGATVDLIPDAGGAASSALGGLGGNLGRAAGHVAGQALDKQVKPVTVTLPTLDLKDIGNTDGKMQGAEIKDVAAAVIEAMAAAAAKSEDLPFDPGLMSGNLDSVKDKVGSQVQGQLDKLPGGAGKVLGGLLGGNKGK